ncbi:MAG: TIGR04290 family methyltransferase [Chloroflexota bacterium]|nr:TIGR04290 family methyltransferase [Chloroflexota bacterium]
MQSALEARVHELGPWFHNLRLGEHADVHTAPDHPLGDFPSNFWQFFKQALPQDLTGLSVLDIGCNGGFYSFEVKRRGARRVLGVDHDPVYLAQARFAREQLGLDVEFMQGDVYQIDRLVGGEQFDYVVFMGVLYHLRHPLYALEKVAGLVRQRLLFQTMERGIWDTTTFEPDYPIGERDVFFDDRFPRMYFVEHAYAGDDTNWWIPNPACTQALLRSVGLQVVDRPCQEVYVCRPRAAAS